MQHLDRRMLRKFSEMPNFITAVQAQKLSGSLKN
jgi:hypothetical protein